MPTKFQIRITRSILQKAAYCGHIKEKGKYIASDDEAVNVSCNCAIALAIRDIFPDAIVGPDTIIPFGDQPYANCYSEIYLPPKAQRFIRDFDALFPAERRKMDTLEFSIDIPDDVLEHAVQIGFITDLVK